MDNDINNTPAVKSDPAAPGKLLSTILHVVVLVLSVLLILYISVDTLNNVNILNEPRFLNFEFWVCVVFMADFVIEFILTKRKWHYLWTHFLFLLVSIPYVAIIHHYGWFFSPQLEYLLRYLPLVRGGYALAIVVGWFTYNKASGLFVTYVVTLIATVYFCSLAFFVFEKGINPNVTTYGDALWWAAMDMTTVGSNVVAMTTVGRVLSVVLAALGMMMFPIFTVYITSLIQNKRSQGSALS